MAVSWANGSFQGVLTKDDGGQRQYGLALGPTYPSFYVAPLIGVANDFPSTAASPFAAFETGYLAVYRIAATGVIRFFISTDGVTFSQLGSDRSSPAGDMFDRTSKVRVGGYNTNTLKVYLAELYNGIPPILGGSGSATPVQKFNPNDWITGNTWTSSTTGEVWTRNGSALIYPETKISSITSAQHTLSSPNVITGHHLNISYSNAI